MPSSDQLFYTPFLKQWKTSRDCDTNEVSNGNIYLQIDCIEGFTINFIKVIEFPFRKQIWFCFYYKSFAIIREFNDFKRPQQSSKIH